MARRKKTEIVVTPDSILGDVSAELEAVTNLGYSEDMDDSLIPILSILQDNSGECKKRHDRHISSAEPGMLIIRVLQKLYSGDEGLDFQPCGFEHAWVEWSGEPGEGAVVRQYPFDKCPSEAEEIIDPQNTDRTILRLPNGNRLVDTRYHFGNVILGGDEGLLPVVVPFSGTNHTVSRQWTTIMRRIRIPGSDKKAPSWFRSYILSSTFTQRGAQSWYKYAVKDAGWVTSKATREAGAALTESVAAMAVRAGADSESGEEDDNIPV